LHSCGDRAIRFERLPKEFDGETAEFADEPSHFLVDVVGDSEFEQSRSPTSRQKPLRAPLGRLVA
jgi:hypothetical protein